eukprot:4534836-Karenia_brevis.AAC.2
MMRRRGGGVLSGCNQLARRERAKAVSSTMSYGPPCFLVEQNCTKPGIIAFDYLHEGRAPVVIEVWLV